MLEFVRDKEILENNPFETASVKVIHNLPYLNITNQEFGGNAHRIAELKDSDLFLLLDRQSKTIAILKMKVEQKSKK